MGTLPSESKGSLPNLAVVQRGKGAPEREGLGRGDLCTAAGRGVGGGGGQSEAGQPGAQGQLHIW